MKPVSESRQLWSENDTQLASMHKGFEGEVLHREVSRDAL